MVGVEADPWHTGSDPMCLESPGAGSWTAVNDISEPIACHEELAAAKRVRANSDKVVAGQLRSRPDDSALGTPVAYLNSHQETHTVEPAHQCWRKARLGVRPEGFAVVNAIKGMFDVAVRRQHKRRHTASRLQPFEVLRRQ